MILASSGVIAVGRHDDSNALPPEIARYLAFASEHRSVDLRHPIKVTFADGNAFLRAAEKSTQLAYEKQPPRNLREQFGYDVETLTALGLLSIDDAYEGAVPFKLVQAYYSPVEHRIVAKTARSSIPGFRAAVLVHELTHALQFDGLGLTDRRGDRDVDSYGFQALLEGDATRIQDEYVASLSSADRDAYDAFAVKRRSLTVDPAHPWQRALGYIPYLVGAAYTRLVAATGGDEAVTHYLRQPPTSDRWLVDPLAEFDRKRVVPLEPSVPVDAVPRGGTDPFGATPLFVTLAASMDPLMALRATDGVFADGFRRYEVRGKVCVAAAFQTWNGLQRRELLDALSLWASRRPRGTASFVDNGVSAQITSCPTRTKQQFDPRVADAMFLLAQRTDGLRHAKDAGLAVGRERCFVNEFVNQYDLAALGASAAQRAMAEQIGERVRRYCST